MFSNPSPDLGRHRNQPVRQFAWAPLFALLSASIAIAFSPAANAATTLYELDTMKSQYLRPKTVPYPKGNKYNQVRFELGRQLFFDTRLSGPGTMSCASCHNPDLAWGDGLPTGRGVAANRLDRRSPTLLNLAWAQLLFWDGRADTLEEQAVGPIQNPDEMAHTMPRLVETLQNNANYRTRFGKAYPNEPISATTIGKALATFERTIVSAQAPFDRWIAGDESGIGDAAKRGFIAFNTKAHCAACHSGWRFTDDSFHDIGLKDNDIGRGSLVEGVEILRHAFKVPGLRYVSLRAPYMHNGALSTLDAVVRHYNDGFQFRPSKSAEIRRLHLTDEEIADVVAFLETLTSADPKVTVPTRLN